MYYFASDTHLGLRAGTDYVGRERLFVRWLNEVSGDAKAIFLVGDIFDFWYEYKRVVPKGFTRVLGKLSELTDRGIEIHFFAGNHDLWAYRYLAEECGVFLHPGAYETFELEGKRVLIGHGDILGPHKRGQRFMSRIFRNRFIQHIFNWVHPDTALLLGESWSESNRTSKPVKHTFKGEQEPIVKFAREILNHEQVDLFICGHIHVAELYPLTESSQIAFLGEWIEHPTFGLLNKSGFALKRYIP